MLSIKAEAWEDFYFSILLCIRSTRAYITLSDKHTHMYIANLTYSYIVYLDGQTNKSMHSSLEVSSIAVSLTSLVAVLVRAVTVATFILVVASAFVRTVTVTVATFVLVAASALVRAVTV